MRDRVWDISDEVSDFLFAQEREYKGTRRVSVASISGDRVEHDMKEREMTDKRAGRVPRG